MIHVEEMLGIELHAGSTRQIETLETQLLGLPQCLYTQASYFAPGVWVRELRVPGRRPENPLGNLIMGHAHRHANLNIMAEGEKLMILGNSVSRVVAQHVFVSQPGSRKIGWIVEDMVFYSIHHNPTDEQDEAKLEEMFYIKSEAWTKGMAAQQRAAEEKIRSLAHLVEGRPFL